MDVAKALGERLLANKVTEKEVRQIVSEARVEQAKELEWKRLAREMAQIASEVQMRLRLTNRYSVEETADWLLKKVQELQKDK